MTDKMFVTPLGRVLLKQKKENLELSILKRQEELADLSENNPGDGFQDSYVTDAQMNVHLIGQQLQEITHLLAKTRMVSIPQQTERVSLGHSVRLALRYPTGERELLTVILIPSEELSLVEKHLLDDEIAISPGSTLGEAICGRKVGAIFSYNIEEGLVKGQVLNIKVWQNAFNYTEITSG
jgi:transcription elongation GreA/GreB family factor